MYYLANYHCHTHFSDGKQSIDQYVKRALQNNMQAIGFSDHAPVQLDCNWTMPLVKLPDYLSQIKEAKLTYQGQINVFTSLEVDYIPGLISLETDYIQAAQLDYTIGSVHFVDFLPNGEPWCIDCTTKVFEEGLAQIFMGDVKTAVSRYYELIREMIEQTRPDIVGHVDRIRKCNIRNAFWNEKEDWYREQVMLTLQTIADNNCIMEINTKGFYRKWEDDAYPRLWIVEEALKMGIPVHAASDAHHPKYLIGGFDFVHDNLKKAGCEASMHFDGNSWIGKPLA